jgi:hypothetical protein
VRRPKIHPNRFSSVLHCVNILVRCGEYNLLLYGLDGNWQLVVWVSWLSLFVLAVGHVFVGAWFCFLDHRFQRSFSPHSYFKVLNSNSNGFFSCMVLCMLNFKSGQIVLLLQLTLSRDQVPI